MDSHISSCMVWTQNIPVSWRRPEDDARTSRVTAGARVHDNGVCKPLREQNESKKTGVYRHVPHRDKPPQVVERRNARERRRVQAVNNAFNKLRKAVPLENTRGKRISKVKTLQNAIEYIQRLEQLLEYGPYGSFEPFSTYEYASTDDNFFDDLDFRN